jgi:hypothetical protein
VVTYTSRAGLVVMGRGRVVVRAATRSPGTAKVLILGCREPRQEAVGVGVGHLVVQAVPVPLAR